MLFRNKKNDFWNDFIKQLRSSFRRKFLASQSIDMTMIWSRVSESLSLSVLCIKEKLNFITENKVVSHFFPSTVTSLQKQLVHVSSYNWVFLKLWTCLGVWRPVAKATCTTSNNSWLPLCSPNCLYKQHPKHEPNSSVNIVQQI